MHVHWQNLSRRVMSRGSERRFVFSRAGRAWLHAEKWNTRVEWSWSRLPNIGASITFDGPGGDDSFTIHLALLFVSVWWALRTRWATRLGAWLGRHGLLPGEKIDAYDVFPRAVEMRLYYAGELAFSWNLWAPTDSWSSKFPRWRNGLAYPMQRLTDLLFGKEEREQTEIDYAEIVVPMPEGSYRAEAKVTQDVRRRPRFPFWPLTRSYWRAEVTFEDGGVPHHGKGENSWDCGDDATMSMSFPVKPSPAVSWPDIIGYVTTDCLRVRGRYGPSTPFFAWEQVRYARKASA